MKSILIVCMGNICRSPMAQVVLESMVARSGLANKVAIESAGTHAQNIGEKPDPRAVSALLRRGYEVRNLRSRRVSREDFARFDWILAMDSTNLTHLMKLSPQEYAPKLRMFLETSADLAISEVPDPYYGNASGFDRVLDLCELGARQLLLRLT